MTAAVAREEEKLSACVHCGFCLPACPTYTRLGDEADSPRGRLYLMRAVTEGRIEPDADAFRTHLDRCLGCRACETVCPSGVEYGYLLEHAREAIVRAGGAGPATRVLLRLFKSRWATRLAMLAGRWLRDTGMARILARRIPARLRSARFGLAMLAASRGTGLAESGRLGSIRLTAKSENPRSGQKIALLTGCVQEGLFGRVNRATERVLGANGHETVPVREQRCCGALHAHAGELEDARDLARRNIDAFERAEVDAVVVNAAGCGAAMKGYAELLEGDPAYAGRAVAFSERVRDLFEFLAETGIRPGAPLPLRAAYDAPCHLHHAQGIENAPLAVLRSVPGLDVSPIENSDECCGGAGTYGLMHAELGGSILDDKIRAVLESEAEAVLTPNPGCIMQVGAGLVLAGSDMPVLHPVELLDESYRRA